MTYDLYDRNGRAMIKVSRINIHSYNLKGYEGRPHQHVYMRLNPEEIHKFKKDFKLYTKEELRKKNAKNLRNKYTLRDLLISANFNLNGVKAEKLWERTEKEEIGKQQLQEVVNLLTQGLDLNDSVVKK